MIFLFGFFITFFTFYISKILYKKYPSFLTHPVLLPSVIIIFVLLIFQIDYSVYEKGGQIFTFFLNPAASSLAYLLYKKWDIIKKYAKEVVITVIISSILGVISSYIFVLFLGGERKTALSMVPKSVTTPIAIKISQVIGGVPSLTAVFVIITGITGAIFGPVLLKFFGIDNPIAWGLSMGISSHGIGTARAVEEGELQGAVSGVGFILMGLFTAIFAPFVIFLLNLLLVFLT